MLYVHVCVLLLLRLLHASFPVHGNAFYLFYFISKGFQNILNAAFYGTPGYSQVKFNMINFAITHNADERKVGYAVGLFCGVMYV